MIWVFIIVVAIVSIALYGIYLWRLDKQYKMTVDRAMINSQRSRVESQIYNRELMFADDSHHFIDTNKLLIKFAPTTDTNTIPNYSFFENIGVTPSSIKVEENTSFCLMPFHQSFYSLYIILKEVCTSNGVRCSRSDETYEPGNLLTQIVTSIIKSQFVFAVLDGRNPNVFYEIGIAHALGKPIYLLAHYNNKEKLPFDISSSRLILYKNYNDLEQKLNTILKTVKSDGATTQE